MPYGSQMGITARRYRLSSLLSGALLVSLALLSAFALSACKNKHRGEETTGPIVVGAFLSMTGATATFGESSKRGAVIAVEEANKLGGVLGRKVELVVLDDQGRTEEAGNAVARLIDLDDAVAVMGEVASTLSLVGGRIAQRRKVPMVSPSSTNTQVTQVGDYVFRVCFLDPFQGFAMAKFARERLKMSKVAILKDVRNDYSLGLSAAFKAAFVKLGGTIVAEESNGAGDTEFSAQLTKIKPSAPEGLYVPGYYTEVGSIARQARRLGINAPLMGGDGWESPELRNIGGAAIVGSYYSNHFAADQPSPRAQLFISAYREKYHEPAPALAALGYDATLAILDAVRRAGTTKPAAVRDALARTKNLDAVTGKLTLDANRNPVKPAVVVRVTPQGEVFEAEIPPE
ncbi:MAG: branched-chain amino acid transporter, amino acid-binding protein [Myxococcaceae bacterium]|nr:branched-chain amino acid transporter, amino acid-binding protein [Myxococcaceae bacterium]